MERIKKLYYGVYICRNVYISSKHTKGNGKRIKKKPFLKRVNVAEKNTKGEKRCY